LLSTSVFKKTNEYLVLYQKKVNEYSLVPFKIKRSVIVLFQNKKMCNSTISKIKRSVIVLFQKKTNEYLVLYYNKFFFHWLEQIKIKEKKLI
jgi:hypothetical protein